MCVCARTAEEKLKKSQTATVDVCTQASVSLFVHVESKQEVKTEQTHRTKATTFFFLNTCIIEKIFFSPFKEIGSGSTRWGRKTVCNMKQCLPTQKQQMSFLDGKCAAFVQRKYMTCDWPLTQLH